jgi:LCP family protein required for cell wall assembly
MKRPGLAALLSLPLPGRGQAWLGARRRGALIALPLVLGLLALGVAVALDPKRALDALLARGALVVVLVTIAVVGVYHLLAVGDAFRLGNRLARAARERADVAVASSDANLADVGPIGPPARRRRLSFGSPLLFVALAGVITFYGVVEFVGVRAYQARTAIFADPSTGFAIPGSSFSPRPSATAAIPTGPVTEPPVPTATPVPVPAWAVDGRLNVLLIGSDAGPGRWMARMDTLVVLSIEVATGRAALISIPRYIANIPLPPESAGAGGREVVNGVFTGWLNALYVYAMGRPNDFPGGEARGFRATVGAVQELIAQPLDGAVVVDLNGFVALVEAIGGLWIDVPYTLHDDRYPLPNGRGYISITIPKGCQHLSGERALEYARSRHQDSDYGRMKRQQKVLVALARQVDPIGLLPRVPELLEIARDNLWTTIQPDQLADMAALAARVDTNDVRTFQFWPPETPQHLNAAGLQHIRDTVATAFDDPAVPEPSPTSTPRPCPRD